MRSLWSHLRDMFLRQRRAEGAANASMMLAGGLRAVLFPRQHLELLRLGIVDRYIVGIDDPDVLFHLSHRHYLSTSFGQRERIESALTHYRFEDERYDDRYKQAVYGSSNGIELWSRTIGGACYALKLRAPTELRHEGGISVLLCVDDTPICEMSWAWVDATLIGAGAGADHGNEQTILLITKNQSVWRNSPKLEQFREAFPQNLPPYFCLAAVHGIAQANGMKRVGAIRHDFQVAFEERHAASFRNSYCELWKSFEAVPAGRVAHVMSVPLATPPIVDVKAKHRRRALDRRRHWSEIARESELALRPFLQGAAGETAAPLPPASRAGPSADGRSLASGLLESALRLQRPSVSR